MLRGRTFGVGLMALAISVAVLACGSDDGESEATASATPASQAATTSEAPPATAGGDAAAPEIDPCALTSKAEIEGALGAPVGDGTPTVVSPEFVSCDWEDADGFPAASVVVLVYPSEEAAGTEFASTIERNGYEELPDLGDRAYTSLIFDVTVLAGRIELSVDLVPQTDEQVSGGTLDASIELTRLALDRLP